MNQHEAARIGRRIAQRRRSLGLGLRPLAKQAGVDYSWLFRLERGEFADPDRAKLGRVLEALELSPGRRIDSELAVQLPGARTYFRAKYELTPEQTAQVERYIARLRRQR